jgi:cytochrome P450
MPYAKAWLCFKGPDVALWILDVNVVQELYTTQNKYFNKHPIVRDLTLQLTGRSILFADTDEMWRKRRTALGPAFYKGKLIQMTDLAKESMRGTLARW